MTKNSEGNTSNNSFNELANILLVFLYWVKKNKTFVSISQATCVLIGFLFFSYSKDSVKGKIKVFTHDISIKILVPFFESVKDAEIQGKLDEIWKFGEFNRDGNDIKNIKLYFEGKKSMDDVDTSHFMLQFEQAFIEPDSNTLARLNRILIPSIFKNKKVNLYLKRNKNYSDLCSNYANILTYSIEESRKVQNQEEIKRLEPILNYFKTLGTQYRNKSELKLTILEINKTKIRPFKSAFIAFIMTQVIFLIGYILVKFRK